MHINMVDRRALQCSLLIFIFMYLLAKSFVAQGSSIMSKDILNYLKVGKEISTVKHQMPLRRTRSSSVNLASKFRVGIHLLNYAMAATMIARSGDVSLNPGPTDSCASSTINASMLTEYVTDLNLGSSCLRIGHWNVIY